MKLVFLFLLFLSASDFSQSAPTNLEDGTGRSVNVSEIIPSPKADTKTPVLHDDISVLNNFKRNADPCIERGCKWPKSGRYVYVPYYIESTYTAEEANIILKGLQSFRQYTCIRFIEWTPSHRDYIYFFTRPESGCWSSLGRQNGGQYISLESKGCMHYGTVQHEVLHALGFNHEQVRSDRDRYVRILSNNIDPKQRYNFRKKPTNNLGTPYDFNSVMQYHNYAFSINGKPTIVAKANVNLAFGRASQMSTNDIARINKLYNCCEKQLLEEVDLQKPEFINVTDLQQQKMLH